MERADKESAGVRSRIADRGVEDVSPPSSSHFVGETRGVALGALRGEDLDVMS